MKYSFNRSQTKLNIYDVVVLDKIMKNFVKLKFTKEIFTKFDSYRVRNMINVDKKEIKSGKTKTFATAVDLLSDTVIVFTYKSIDANGTIPEGLSLKLSVHLNDGQARIKHYFYNEAEFNSKYNYLNFLATNDEIDTASKWENGNDLLKKVNDIFSKIENHNAPSAFVSKNEFRCVFFKLLEHEFNLKIFPTHVEANDEVKSKKPKRSKEDLETYFSQMYSIPELNGLLLAIDDKYKAVVDEEKEKLGFNSSEEKVKEATQLLSSIKSEINSVRPEFLKIKEAWSKEKKKIETKCGDDLKKVDEMYEASDLKRDAIALSEKIKSLSVKQKDLEDALVDAQKDLAEKATKLKKTPIYLSKRKYIEGLISFAEKNVEKSVELEMINLNAESDEVEKKEKLKDSYFLRFNDEMSPNASNFIKRLVLPVSPLTQKKKRTPK